MRVLFISRKSFSSVGGLSRFFTALTENFPRPHYVITPKLFGNILQIPYKKIELIYLCDATLLPIGILLKLFLRKPLTVTAHGLDLTFRNPLYQWFLRKALPHTDAIILDSHAAEMLLKPFSIPTQKIHVINPGITVDQFQKPKHMILPNFIEKTVLLSVGNLVPRKGHAWFIKNVFTKLSSDFIYCIVGDGPERKNIEKLIGEHVLAKRVFLLGKLPDKQLAYVYKKAHMYVCPNQIEPDNFESFGIANGEAAAMGLPVVASNVDGISELIKHKKNGLLVNPTPQAFISALHTLKNRKQLEKRAKIYTLKEYAWEKTVKKYLLVFQQAVGNI